MLTFKIEIYNLGKNQINSSTDAYLASDNQLWALIYGDRIIAGMLETRTDSNYINFTYFQNLENLIGCPRNLPNTKPPQNP